MATPKTLRFVMVPGLFALAALAAHAAQTDAPLPSGVKAVWDLDKAFREKTTTTEQVCLNGLWRWQPAKDKEAVPAGNWGYTKVPGPWNGQTLYPHPAWEADSAALRGLNAAWTQREITVPAEWTGRLITVYAEYVNSLAIVYVDGKQAGEIRFPAGEVNVTALCRPGAKHLLSMFLLAIPLKETMLSTNDTNSAKEIKATVGLRGLCGDVYLRGMPSARIAGVKVDPSVRHGNITFNVTLSGLADGPRYTLRAQIVDQDRTVKELTSAPFTAEALQDGRFAFTGNWKAEKLWDINTPQNMYHVNVSLLDAKLETVDQALPVRFGFREFWIDGRDFYLNGTRIWLSCVPLDNAQAGLVASTYEGAKESMRRLKSFGINFVYTHNYGCTPGSHLSFTEILRAADDVGMLVSLSQPHFSAYDWKAEDADQANGYKGHAEFYVRVAQNHPAVVFYSTSHNATGYSEDMNPDMIDGLYNQRDTWSGGNARLALRAQAIITKLDPTRIVYHHSSGNLGSMHTNNFYTNFTPIQETSDWFEHWSTKGTKPAFTCEYGVPFTWDWAMYRGWYKGKREFGSAVAPWELCYAEWNAQFLGDRAFRISEEEKVNLRWEAPKFRKGEVWHRWDYPFVLGAKAFDDHYTVMGLYTADNWRAFRTWGLSANSPWEHSHFWKLREGVDKTPVEYKTDWENLQRPGYSPDGARAGRERMDMGYELSDWIPMAPAQALLRNNMPLLAYIGGKSGSFTSKDHNFLPSQTVEKQLIIINNSRETTYADCEWALALPQPETGRTQVTLPTGEQKHVPMRLKLPSHLRAGQYELSVTVKFSNGENQTDTFMVNVMAPAPRTAVKGRLALFDPKGQTAKLLRELNLKFQPVGAEDDLNGYDVLVIGKQALTADGPGPDVSNVRNGLKIIVFEQTSQVLEKRFGFRVEEYGLRNVFKRVPDHPMLAGLETENLHDWCGAATLLAPSLTYSKDHFSGSPSVKWCDIWVSRPWRCGCRGSVASVMIEKPVRGDFLPVLDGGYSLQYSPLMEYREGEGLVVFCQMDVSGRTEEDPAAQRLARNLIEYVSGWHAAPRRPAVYAGEAAVKEHFTQMGLSVGAYDGQTLTPDQVLIAGPGSGPTLSANAPALSAWVKAGGRVLALGLTEGEANSFLPAKVAMKKAEHIAAYFEPAGCGAPLAGVGPADVHNRDPRELPLVSGGAEAIGDGVLATAEGANVVLSQLVPWTFDQNIQNTKRTFRRTSFLTARLLANMGVSGITPLLARFSSPVDLKDDTQKRWLDSYYLDVPAEWDDPYRFFRW